VNTDRLIEQLVAELTPVRRLLDPTERAALWMALGLVSIAGGLAYFGVRRDIATIWLDPAFTTRLLLLAATMWLAVVTAFRMSVPGAEQRVFVRWWPVAGLGLALALVAADVAIAAMAGPLGSPMRAAHCIQKVTFVGLVPALVAIVLVRRAWAAEPRWTLVLGMVASGVAGAITAELSCPVRAPLHILLWHLLPIVVVVAAGVVVGSAILNARPGKR
jgi:hypothetical protein